MDADTDMSAVVKVFSTVELLENIVLHVQPDYIPDLKCVSKSWHELIRSSPSIRPLIKCLSTVPHLDSVQGYPNGFPTYERGSMIAIHPALHQQTIYYGGQTNRGATLQFEIRDAAEPEVRSLEAEFATRPFYQELCVYHKADLDRNSFPRERKRVIHVDSGIRIGHLVKKCREMAEVLRNKRIEYRTGEEFLIVFREDMSKEDVMEVQRFNKLPLCPPQGGPLKLQTEWPVIKGVRKIEID